jgi:Leucine-rich repeat (LRR) protein
MLNYQVYFPTAGDDDEHSGDKKQKVDNTRAFAVITTWISEDVDHSVNCYVPSQGELDPDALPEYIAALPAFIKTTDLGKTINLIMFQQVPGPIPELHFDACLDLRRVVFSCCSGLTIPPTFTRCLELRELEIYGTPLRIPPVISDCPRMHTLDVHNNQLDTSPIVPFNVSTLRLQNNNLTAPPELTGRDIWRLNLSGNKLTAPPVLSSCSNLRELDLSNNKLTKPPVISNDYLRTLNLANNELVGKLDFSSCVNLKFIDVSGNPGVTNKLMGPKGCKVIAR